MHKILNMNGKHFSISLFKSSFQAKITPENTVSFSTVIYYVHLASFDNLIQRDWIKAHSVQLKLSLAH